MKDYFLAYNLKNYMLKRNLSLAKFCNKVKLQMKIIQNCLDNRSLSLETVEKLANELEVTIDQLLFEKINFN